MGSSTNMCSIARGTHGDELGHLVGRKMALLVVAVLTVCEPLSGIDPVLVRNISFHSSDGSFQLVVELERDVPHRAGRLSDPPRLYFDIVGARIDRNVKVRTIPTGDPVVSQIRLGEPQDDVTRVVLDLAVQATYTLSRLAAPPRLVIDVQAVSPSLPAGAGQRTPQATPPPRPVTPQPAEVSVLLPRVSRAPKIEDFLRGTPREAEAAVTGFLQRTPGDGTLASQQTTAYLSYDDKNLYVVFVCRDEPGKIRARMAKREDINDDDSVAVYLDTFHDRQRAYEFAVNPLGIQQDGVITEGQGTDRNFDTLWHSKAQLTPDGFTVWMAIPFKSLRFSGEPVQVWGIALTRSVQRSGELSTWPLITRRLQGFVQQMGALKGIEQVSSPKNIQFIPYGAFARARFLNSAIPGFSKRNDWRGGLDTKLVLGGSATLDVTVNPDFNQVESDDPQVTINQRFEVFFPEKRPFFIENSGFFRTPINLFFSRRIADPEFGGRLTGKFGRWAVGALASDDRAPGKQVPAGDPLAGDHAMAGVLRVQREFGQQSSIGLLASSRDFGPSWNRVVALDTRLKLSPNWSLAGQVARSYDRQLNGPKREGPGYLASLAYGGRHFSYGSSYTDFSPDFRSQLGFVRRVDVRQMGHNATYFWQPGNRRLLSFGPSLSVGGNWDRHGRLQDLNTYLDFAMHFVGPTGFTVSRYDAYEFFVDRGFRQRITGITFYTNRLKWLSLAGSHHQGTAINYSPPAGLTSFLANTVNSFFSMTFRPTPRLRLEETYYFSRLGTRRGSGLPGLPEAASIFNNHLFRTKLNYQFTRALSVRTILDYYATLSNPALIADTTFKRLTSDVLVTYLLNPGTALYVGYTDRYDNLALDPTIPPRLRPTRSPSTSTARQFFVKISYLLRY